MAKKVFTDDSLATLVNETKSRLDTKLSLSGGEMTGVLYTSASTPLFIGKNGKVGMRAATADKVNVGQINISNAWYGNGNQYGSQISAYNGEVDAYNELRVSHNGLEYNCEDGNTYQVLHTGNYKSTVTPGNIGAALSSHNHTVSNITDLTATATELNYCDGVTSNIQTQLNHKMDDYTIELYNGTAGNPKPVRFASFNYSTCNSEAGIAAKISMVSGHGNGTSYAFLQDAILRVNHTGTVEVDNMKYYGADTGTYDGATRQYGDIFWLTDSTNKIIDFYCLMGQYSRLYQTPWKRLTYSTGGTVTQHTSCTVYSSGTKVWANNNEIAMKNDIVAGTNTTYSLSKSGSTITLTGSDGSTTSVTDADTNTTYSAATTSAAGLMSASDKSKLDAITASADSVSFSRSLSSGTKIGTITINGTATDLYCQTNTDTNTTYSQATSSTLGLVKIGYSASGKNYPVQLNSSGQMYVNVPWTDTNTTYTLSSLGAAAASHNHSGVYQPQILMGWAYESSSGTTGGSDINLSNYSYNISGYFSSGRYSSSYGTGLKVAQAGNYLISATLNLSATAAGNTTTCAVRRVTSSGSSSYLKKANQTLATSGYSTTVSITPFVASLSAGDYISLYQSHSSFETNGNGCWLTLVYIGS